MMKASPNYPAPRKAGITSGLTLQRHWPGLREPVRWAQTVNAHLAFPLLASAVLLCGCMPQSPPGFKEQILPVSAGALKPYPALFSVDRSKMGFPPLPTNGTVRILTVDRSHWNLKYPPPNYDVSFQFYEGSSFYPYTGRHVALIRTNETYKWVSEQMVFHGPKRYTADDQVLNEAITITCETAQIAYQGTNIQGTAVIYSGPDQRLSPSGASVDSLALSHIGPILREWGYKYEADGAQPTAAPNAASPHR
jgi:hypothetical protein